MVRLATFALFTIIASASAAPAIVSRDESSNGSTRVDTKFLRDDASSRVDTKFLRDDSSSRVDTTFLRDDAESSRVDTEFLKRGDETSRVDTAFLRRTADGKSDRSDTILLKRDDSLPESFWHKRGSQLNVIHSARDESQRTDTAFL